MDGALEKAMHPNPGQRYEVLSEFIADLTRPNSSLSATDRPLLEGNPLVFWKGLAVVQLIGILVLVYQLVRGF